MILVTPAFTTLQPASRAEAVAALQRVEAAGRVCYKSEERTTEESYARFVRMLVQRGHWSVLEHASLTARLVTNRGVTHELVRHRVASFSQESTRYCNYGQEKFGHAISVVAPPELEDEALATWRTAMAAAEAAYLEFLRRGVAPEVARGVLPHDLKTELVITANLREWHHLFAVRCAPAAHPHARHLLRLGLAQVIPLFAPVFDDLRPLLDAPPA